jgi:hypothetical protein
MLVALPAPTFAVGQSVATNGGTNVRATADGVLLGTQQKGAMGTVTAGPSNVSGNLTTWYKVEFAISPSGWVGGDMLIGSSVPHQTLGAGLRPVIVSDGRGVVDVAWENSNGGMGQFRRSVDGGATFGPRVPITNPVLPGTGLQLAVDAQGAPTVMWLQGGGSQFTPRTSLAHGPAWTPRQVPASVDTRDGGLAALIVEPTGPLDVASVAFNGRLLASRSVDGGASWSTDSVWSAPQDNGAVLPAGAALGGGDTRLALVWLQQSVQQCNVMATVGAVGVGWRAATQIATGAACDTQPIVEVDPAGRIDTMWSSYGGPLWFAQSRDVSITWLPPVAVRDTPALPPGTVQSFATMADGTIVAVWAENTGAVDANGAPATRVMQSVSGDGGDSWGTVTTLSLPLHTGFSGARAPQVVGDGTVAWLDDAAGSFAGDFRVYLGGKDVSGGPSPAVQSFGLGLGRVVSWSDGQSVFYATVPH